MLLSYSVLGDAELNTAIPPKKEYSTIKFSGECILDNIHVQNVELDDQTILNIETEQQWGVNTIFLANFEDTLEAGNLQNSDMPITHWRIYRKKSDEQLYTLLAEIPFDKAVSEYIDYTPGNQIEYEYKVHPVSNGTEGNPIAGISMADFFGWILTDGNTTYTFDMEVETENIQSIIDLKQYENNTQYPAFRFGNRQYDKGVLRTIPGTINGNIIQQTAEDLENLKTFINNKQIKTLKNSKGQVWQVITHDFNYKFMDKTSDQIAIISFAWTQVGAGE